MSEFKKKENNVIILDEVPSDLKELARLVVRGFYTTEDVLIIDLIVKNSCMKEKDIAELLLFEKKQLRARLAILKNDKFVQERLKIITGADGKAQKVNYYFIHYKRFANVVKYKLDQMQKSLETEERPVTHIASFRCLNCQKTFTDLDADQLFDFESEEFRCTFCSRIVEEDAASLRRRDSRLMLARFNKQMQVLYDLLSSAEGIHLSRNVLEPEPVDINFIRGIVQSNVGPRESVLSGAATINQGLKVDESLVKSLIGNKNYDNMKLVKEQPVWMTESTVNSYISTGNYSNGDATGSNSASDQFKINSPEINIQSFSISNNKNNRNKKDCEDIMAILLKHERKLEVNNGNPINKSQDSELEIKKPKLTFIDEDEDENVPNVLVAGTQYPIDEISEKLIGQMSSQEKEIYINVFQSFYSEYCD